MADPARPSRAAPGAADAPVRGRDRTAGARTGGDSRPRTAAGRAADVASGQRESRERLILAPNWRTPLLVDVVLGAVVLLVGLALAIAWNPIGGGGLGALGGLYASLALRRWGRWAAVRREAGLDAGRPGRGAGLR